MRSLIALHLVGAMLFCSPVYAQSAGYTWTVVDGKIVISSTKKSTGTTQLLKPPSTPTSLPSNHGSQGTVVDLANEAIKTAKYWAEGERAAKAREQARVSAQKALEGSSAKFASVPWLSDRPHDVSDSESPQLYHYRTGTPRTSDDIHEVRKAIYGPLQDEISSPAPGQAQDAPGYLRGTMIAERNPDGTITTRTATPADARSYVHEESERIRRKEEEIQKEKTLLQEKAQRAYEDAEKRSQQLKQKQLAAQEAKKQEEEIRKQKEEAQRARDSAERERKESEARAKQLAENQKALEKRYKERDDACSKGRTANCIYVDDRLTNDFDKIIKNQNTARCMQFEPGEGPKGGPCAPDAPPCMYCSADAQMRKQQRWETYLALEVTTRRTLIQNSATPLSAFDNAVRARMTGKLTTATFGLNEFIRGKYGD